MSEQSKIDKWYQHEALDRTHTILYMLQELLGYCDKDDEFEDINLHPGIWNERCKDSLSTATQALAELYQAIGEWEDE